MSEDSKKHPGRPRKHDRDRIAIDMILWAKKDESINFNKFCALYDPPFAPSKITEWSKEEEAFREAYEIACAFLAFRREENLNSGKLHVKAYDLNASVYDYFVRLERRQHMEFEESLKSSENNTIPEEAIQRFDAFMNQLNRLQAPANDLKTNSTDNKS